MTIVTQISIGRFHHFHLARQMQKHHLLNCIYTGYPKYKLKDEEGISREKIKTFPWLHTPYMALASLGMPALMEDNLRWIAAETLDAYVKSKMTKPTVLIGLSGYGLKSGKKAQSLGGNYICDRGSTHIQFQNELLKEEYSLHNFKFPGVDPKIIGKELEEYDQADKIAVPSEFVRNSFISMGVSQEKLIKVPYGARLERFRKVADPPTDVFRVLWVGSVTLRKGFLYLLTAFQNFSHPNKQLVVVGGITKEVQTLLRNQNLSNVVFKGLVPNTELAAIYSSSHVFVLPSIEEGLAMVQGEALACGCPVIATPNSGAEDLITDGVEGFIVPIRSSAHITDKLQQMADDRNLRQRLSEAALQRVKTIGGWDTYGNAMASEVKKLAGQDLAFSATREKPHSSIK